MSGSILLTRRDSRAYNGDMGTKKSDVIVNTGNGKGKTTSALGVVLRASGYGHKVLIVQFIKGSWRSGEMDALARLDNVELMRVGKGFIGMLGDKLPFAEHQAAAREGLAQASAKMSGGYDLVVLDEINNAVYMDLVPLDDVIALVENRPPATSMILTGRHAHPRLIALADLVTEMRDIKHPAGALRKGIGF
jgi:cob(I)alamin adenosyltransferase